MKPFDLGAANKGALFFRFGAPTVLLRYVGMRRGGGIVYEDDALSPMSIFGSESMSGLRMVARKVERWVNIYRGCGTDALALGKRTHATEREAVAVRTSSCVGTVRIEWEE